MICIFSTIMQTILEFTNRGTYQIPFIQGILHSFYDAVPFFTCDNVTISRWISGEYAVPRRIGDYYSEENNREELITDFEKYVYFRIIDIVPLTSKLYDLVMSDMSLSEYRKKELTEGYPFEDKEAMIKFIGSLIYFGLTRKPLSGNEKSLPAEQLSPRTLDVIIGNNVPSPCKYFCGRDTELEELHTLLSDNDKIFISGIAGIGKSELAKAYAKKHKKLYTNILYFYYNGSLENMITEMDFANDLTGETTESRFKKHNRFLRSLKSDSLLIVDNFNAADHKDAFFGTMMKYNCKIIFTSRCSHESGHTYELNEISDKDILFDLFGKFYPDTEKYRNTVENIIETVHHHTMAVELSARLMKKGILSPEDILKRLTESIAAPKSDDKIGMKKDGSNTNTTYYNHIKTLFSLFLLDEENKYIMRCTVFSPAFGMLIKMFADIAELTDLNGVNELVETGFIQNNDTDMITLHPLIRDIAIADLQPDFSNCKTFIDNVHKICLVVGMNVAYNKTVLAVAENIIRYSIKTDVPEYLRFMEDAFNFMENYSYESGMSLVVSEMTALLDLSKKEKNNDAALLYNFKSSYENLFTENINKALNYANRALKLCNADDNPVLYANLNMNLGNLYMQKKDYDNARVYMETAISLISSANIPTADVVFMSRNYAHLLFLMGEKSRALTALVKCAEFAEKVNHIEYPSILFDEAMFCLNMKFTGEAVELFRLSLNAYYNMGMFEELQTRQIQAAALLSKYGIAVPQTPELP